MNDYSTTFEESSMEKEEEPEKGATGDNLLSPEGFFMMFFAIIFDLTGLLLEGIGALVAFLPAIGIVGSFLFEVLSKIVSFCALIVFGIWMLLKTGSTSRIKNRASVNKTAAWLKKFRFLAPIAEMVPILSILPWWTITVYMELKHGNN